MAEPQSGQALGILDKTSDAHGRQGADVGCGTAIPSAIIRARKVWIDGAELDDANNPRSGR